MIVDFVNYLTDHTFMAVASHMPVRLSVAVIGLGSIGGVAAGCLAAAGRHDVIACVRKPLDRLTLDRRVARPKSRSGP